MSDSSGEEISNNGTNKRRKFSENRGKEPMEKSKSPESRSPSPPLPSRLDRIPSPATLRNDKQDERRSGDIPEAELKREGSRSRSASRSPTRKRRSKSRSPRKSRHSKSPIRKRRSRSGSRDRRRRSRSGSREHKRRSRSRSQDRKRKERRRRSRSRSKNRRPSGSGSRRRSPPRRSPPRRSPPRRSPRRSPPRRRRSRSPSPRFTSKWGMKRTTGFTRAVLPENGDERKPRQVSTQEVEERLAKHMKSVQEKAAEEAKRINLPGYLNPAMVNVHQFKQVQDKRKLLWSKAKDKKEGATQWAGAFDDQGNDEKFRRLMGIQGIDVETDSSKIQQSRQVLNNLEKEYEKSRAFQLSRGAGGVTGMGLGFGSLPQQPQ